MCLLLLVLWFFICAVFVGSSSIYFLYTSKMSRKPWNIKVNENYQPKVAVLVPVHNEEKAIQLKLRNLEKIVYPADKFEVFIVNDASTDNTLKEIENYKLTNTSMKIRILSSQEHIGKTSCLNRGLKSIDADIIVLSDADCFMPSDILEKTLPFMSDPQVGAVCARELLLNPHGSWVTTGEQFFDNTVEAIRIGESKIYSTIIFHGGFAVFKRSVLDEFDREVDDSGTAFSILQKDHRTLLIPETAFFTPFPTIWKNKLTIKIRRASQLQHLWAKCAKLMVKGKLRMPKRIAMPEIFLHIFNPMLLVAFIIATAFGIFEYPVFFGLFFILFFAVLAVKKTRTILIEALQSNFILLAALPSFFNNKGFRLWKTVQESRNLITEEILKQNNLL
jgi:cellulose synthase/poly-beta-1,6-N-acetylglucosamine synthase-like glycosyltransferase